MSSSEVPKGLAFLPAALASGYFWRKHKQEGRGDVIEYVSGTGAIIMGAMFLHSAQTLVLKPNAFGVSIQNAFVSLVISIITAFLVTGFSAPYARNFFNQDKTAASVFVSLFVLVNAMTVFVVMTIGFSYYSFADAIGHMGVAGNLKMLGMSMR